MAEVTEADRAAQVYYWGATVAGTTDVGGEILAQAFAAHREAAEKAERQAVVNWLLSDDARLDYEASGSEEHFSWWAADVIQRGDHRKG